MTRYKLEPDLLELVDAIAAGHVHTNGAPVNATDAVRIAIIEAATARGLFRKKRPKGQKPVPPAVARRLGYRDSAGRLNRSHAAD